MVGGGGLGGMMGGYYYGGAEGASQISVIPIWLVGLALVFSTLIGLVSGFLRPTGQLKSVRWKRLNMNKKWTDLIRPFFCNQYFYGKNTGYLES